MRQPIDRFARLLPVACLVLFAATARAAGGGDDHDPLKEAMWQGFNLLLIVGIIAYFARKPIQAFFESRRTEIKTELTTASELLDKAEQRNAELQRRLVDLSSEVEEIREGASQRAEEEAERILADARATADRIRNDAKSAVDQELWRAQAELRDEAADLALELAARKLTDNVAESDRDRLMDEFITRVEPGDSSVGSGGSRA